MPEAGGSGAGGVEVTVTGSLRPDLGADEKHPYTRYDNDDTAFNVGDSFIHRPEVSGSYGRIILGSSSAVWKFEDLELVVTPMGPTKKL